MSLGSQMVKAIGFPHDFARGTLIKESRPWACKRQNVGALLNYEFLFPVLWPALVQKLFQFALHPSFREETYHTPPPLLPKSAYYIPKGFDKILSNKHIFLQNISGNFVFKVLVSGFDY